MYFSDYLPRLVADHASIGREAGSIEDGPLVRPTRANSPPWNMDWIVRFPDGKHAYLYERWLPDPASPRVGGVHMGARRVFSFHYGPTPTATRKNGFPARDKANYPAIIRIDNNQFGPHLHFHSEEPHISQVKVNGLNISDLQPCDFMRAVLEHRSTGVDFDEIMKFKVIP